DQRGAIAHEDRPLAAHQRLMSDTQTEVGLAATGRGHDELVLVALANSITQALMCRFLESAGSREGRAVVVHLIAEQGFVHAATLSSFSNLARHILACLTAMFFSFIKPFTRSRRTRFSSVRRLTSSTAAA